MEDTLSLNLERVAKKRSLADGTPCHTISAEDVARLAKASNLTGRSVELSALKQHILPDRYLRNMKTFSEADQITLLESAVCIVGLGGLGGMVTETLARMGIGRLHLIDGDVFEGHNLNRQLLSSTNLLGLPKAEAAVKRVKAINPGLEVYAPTAFLTPENAVTALTSCDMAVDCLDNIQSRFTLQTAAKRRGIPMVSAAVAGVSGHVTTIFPEDQGLENIYGPEDQLTVAKGEETRLGCLAPGVNLIASLECMEVVHLLLNPKKTLRNRLMVVDLDDYTIETLKLV